MDNGLYWFCLCDVPANLLIIIDMFLYSCQFYYIIRCLDIVVILDSGKNTIKLHISPIHNKVSLLFLTVNSVCYYTATIYHC